MPNLLVEIGTEELPLDSLDVLYRDLPSKIEKAFREARLPFEEVKMEATPRRIAFFVRALGLKQSEQILEFSGPSFEQAYDGEGKPTKALEGFLRSKNSELKDVSIKETPKGKFIQVKKKELGKPTAKVLPGILVSILTSLSFPKLMRWEATGFRFPRPIRWLVVLLDKTVVPVRFADLVSGRTSLGHRFLSPASFSIPSADWEIYRKLLQKKHVILDLCTREQIIQNTLETKFHHKKIDAELLHLNAQLVEEPFFITGSFNKEYLKLPAEVLATVMKKNQKIFACYDAKGQAVNRFVAVLNGKRNGLPRIQSDFENVLFSRLKDAQYFYAEDTRQPLEAKVSSLEQIIYLGKLGTLKDKISRLEKLAEFFTDQTGHSELREDLKRACKLCKADLMTHLVFEMPDLQGVVGGEYARVAGEKQEVSNAIRTQYLPKNLAEDFGSVQKEIGLLGAMLGILDRLDLLVGAFGLDMAPSGSQDPFALRRAGGVLVKLIRAYPLRFSLFALVEKNYDLFGAALKVSKQDLVKKFSQFLQDRLIFELGLNPGTRAHEILQAVVRSDSDHLAGIFDRFSILSQMEKNEINVFKEAAKIVERTSNILKGAARNTLGEPDLNLLSEDCERALFKAWQENKSKIEKAIQNHEYAQATRFYADHFGKPIHDFFSKVLVNVEDASIRKNRQALMNRICDLYASRVADLSLLSKFE